MTDVIDLTFEGAPIRSVIIDGEPGFAGKDVCRRLGYANPNKAMGDHCKGVTKRYPIPDTTDAPKACYCKGVTKHHPLPKEGL